MTIKLCGFLLVTVSLLAFVTVAFMRGSKHPSTWL